MGQDVDLVLLGEFLEDLGETLVVELGDDFAAALGRQVVDDVGSVGGLEVGQRRDQVGGALVRLAAVQALDVVPLRDVIRTSINPPGYAGYTGVGTFEKCVYAPPTGPAVQAMPPRDFYAHTVDPANHLPDAPNGVAAGSTMNEGNHYICAWGPNDQIKPRMLRIIMRVDDANGKLSDGQTFEYTINLP